MSCSRAVKFGTESLIGGMKERASQDNTARECERATREVQIQSSTNQQVKLTQSKTQKTALLAEKRNKSHVANFLKAIATKIQVDQVEVNQSREEMTSCLTIYKEVKTIMLVVMQPNCRA